MFNIKGLQALVQSDLLLYLAVLSLFAISIVDFHSEYRCMKFNFIFSVVLFFTDTCTKIVFGLYIDEGSSKSTLGFVFFLSHIN